jgi:hypothetical protein
MPFIYSLNHLSSATSTSLRSDSRNRFLLDVPCSNSPIILVLFFKIVWIVEFMRPNSYTCRLHSFSIFLITSTFSSTLKPSVGECSYVITSPLPMSLFRPRIDVATWQSRDTRWRSGWGTALQTGRSRDRFPMVSLELSIDIILPTAIWP